MIPTPDELKKANDEARKTFRVCPQIGTTKYSVSFCDGQQTHRDGSPFFDLRIFKNKKSLANYVADLKSQGYAEAQMF